MADIMIAEWNGRFVKEQLLSDLYVGVSTRSGKTAIDIRAKDFEGGHARSSCHQRPLAADTKPPPIS